MRTETEIKCPRLANIIHRIEAAFLCLIAKDVVCMSIRPKARKMAVYVLSESDRLNDNVEFLTRAFLKVWNKEE